MEVSSRPYSTSRGKLLRSVAGVTGGDLEEEAWNRNVQIDLLKAITLRMEGTSLAVRRVKTHHFLQGT